MDGACSFFGSDRSRSRYLKLQLYRNPSDRGATIGELFADGVFQTYVLEDVIREIPGVPVSKWKVPGDTAIPEGTYKVEITFSQRFREDLPLVLGVPGFVGIRIHAGNTAQDTEGCILVGHWRGGPRLFESRKALEALMAVLETAVATQRPISLEIINPVGEPK